MNRRRATGSGVSPRAGRPGSLAALVGAATLACLTGASPAPAQQVLPPAPAAAVSAGKPDAGPADRAQSILHMLDYVAVDYPDVVKDGKVVDQSEYDEQLEFVTQVRVLLEQLAARPEQGELIARADRLVALVSDKRPGVEVAGLANQLRWAIVEAYDVEVSPKRPPDLRPAAALYAARCAAVSRRHRAG